jgi:hypothetical protein
MSGRQATPATDGIRPVPQHAKGGGVQSRGSGTWPFCSQLAIAQQQNAAVLAICEWLATMSEEI